MYMVVGILEVIAAVLKLFGAWRGELPQNLTPQVEPVGAQLLSEDEVLKRDKTRLSVPFRHSGHLMSISLSLMLRRNSNFLPHSGHSYS